MEPSQRSIRTEGNPDHGCDWAERAFVNATPPTSTDHVIDVLARLRDELAEFYGDKMPPYYGEEGQALAEANAILKTYGR